MDMHLVIVTYPRSNEKKSRDLSHSEQEIGIAWSIFWMQEQRTAKVGPKVHVSLHLNHTQNNVNLVA
jgi:hypothetical protein